MSRTGHLADNILATFGRTTGLVTKQVALSDARASSAAFNEHILALEQLSAAPVDQARSDRAYGKGSSIDAALQGAAELEPRDETANPTAPLPIILDSSEHLGVQKWGEGEKPELSDTGQSDEQSELNLVALSIRSGNAVQWPAIAQRGSGSGNAPTFDSENAMGRGSTTGSERFIAPSPNIQPEDGRRNLEPIAAPGEGRTSLTATKHGPAAGSSAPLSSSSFARSPHRSTSADDVALNVLRNETHLAPVRQMPVEQIANAILSGGQSSSAGRSLSGVEAPLLHRPATQTVRVLQVQLEPKELGAITVHLKLASNALEVRVESEKARTAELIRKDQAALTRLLQSAGYDVEVLAVHVAELDRSSGIGTTSQGAQAQGHQGALQSQSEGSSADGRWASRQQEGDRQREPHTYTVKRGDEPSSGAPPRQDGIYV